MAVTTTPKFGFPLATSGADPTPDRARWMDIFGALEGKALSLGYGPLSGRPSAPASPMAWFDSALDRLSIHPGVGGGWTNVTPLATATPPAGVYGGAGTVGTSDKAAREDHSHPLPSIQRTDLPAIVAADLPTVPVSKGGTGATSLTAGSFLRGAGTGAIATRTPAQVLTDIGAAAAAAGIPAGGTAGQVLKKATGTNFDAAWADGTVQAATITDATPVGRAVLTAASQTAARAAIAAGTSSFAGSYTALTDKPTINSKTVAGDVTLTPADVGAQPAGSYATGAQGAKADTAVQPARKVSSGTGLTGGGDLSVDRSLAVVYGTAAGTAAQGNDSRITSAVPNSRTVNGHALTGDVTVSKADVGLSNVDNTADATKSVASAAKLTTARTINGVAFDGTAAITVADATKVPTGRKVSAGTGLTGGGDLSADRSLAVAYGTAAGTAAQGNDSRITGAVPNSRKVNGKALTGDVTLTAGDVGAATAAQGSTADAAIPKASGIVTVRHGTNAAIARPAGADVVWWIGSVEPTNALAHDAWDDSEAS